MSIARFDVSDFDDEELGAEVRAAFADGHNVALLYDSTQNAEKDRRALTWPDGHHGLYRLQCSKGHVWLSALSNRHWVQGHCPTCDNPGGAVEDGLRAIS